MNENEKYKIEDFWPDAEKMLDQHFESKKGFNFKFGLISLLVLMVGGVSAWYFLSSGSSELNTLAVDSKTKMEVNSSSSVKNTDLSSRLKFGEETRSSKSANATSSYSADNFIPLVPSLAENVQNVDHIIPTFWVRGGMSSRAVIRNIDYMKSCGLNK